MSSDEKVTITKAQLERYETMSSRVMACEAHIKTVSLCKEEVSECAAALKDAKAALDEARDAQDKMIIRINDPQRELFGDPENGGNERVVRDQFQDILIESIDEAYGMTVNMLNKLLGAGLDTIGDVENHPDLTSLKGIGDSMSKCIMKVLQDYKDAN